MTMATNNNPLLNCPPLRFPEFSDPWKKTTLGEVAEFIQYRGKSNTLYLSVESFLPNFQGIADLQNDTQSSGIGFEPDDVLMSNIRPYLRKVWYANRSGTCSPDVLVFRSKSVILPKFLYSIIANQSFVSYIMQGAKGVKMPRGDKQQMLLYSFSLPHFSEQGKIAEFLSLIDERIETQRQTIEERKKQKKALICNFFKEIDFSTCPISDFGELKNGYAFRSDTYDCNGSHRIITISNVTGDRYTNMSNHNSVRTLPKDIKPHQILRHNDILISLTGNVGRVSLCSVDGDLLNQRVGVLKVFDSFYKQYVYHLLSSRHFEQSMIDRGQGAAQLNISKTDIENYNIPIPHNKSIIPILSNTLNCFDERIEVEEKLLGKYEEQKQYLLRKMFV